MTKRLQDKMGKVIAMNDKYMNDVVKKMMERN